MNTRRWTAVAAAVLLGALLSDWAFTELFLARDSTAAIAGALAVNVLAFTVVALLVGWLSARAQVVLLRAWILLGLVALAYKVVHASGVTLPGGNPWLRLGLAGLVLAGTVAAAVRISDEVGKRLARAVALGSIAFVLAPFVWRAAIGGVHVWIEAAPAGSDRTAVAFLLLDEMGADAAHPMAEMLRQSGLSVSENRLVPAGENTENAIPAMFTGVPFDHVRPCGTATVCSGTTFLDFSSIRVARPDVHVTGLLLPYCRIAGLASCFQLPLPHEYGSAWRSLAAFWLRRVGVALTPQPEPPGLQRRLLAMQSGFVDHSAFWGDGGILYAHLPVPHPPGLDSTTTLDADYAGNLAEAQALVRRTAERLRVSFGTRFTLIVTSDHPLRRYWCSSGVYRSEDCTLREAFRSDRVPLIVAAPQPVDLPGLTTNRDVFKLLGWLSGAGHGPAGSRRNSATPGGRFAAAPQAASPVDSNSPTPCPSAAPSAPQRDAANAVTASASAAPIVEAFR